MSQKEFQTSNKRQVAYTSRQQNTGKWEKRDDGQGFNRGHIFNRQQVSHGSKHRPSQQELEKKQDKYTINLYKQKIKEMAMKDDFDPEKCANWCKSESNNDIRRSFNIGHVLFSRLGEFQNLLDVIKLLANNKFFDFLKHKKKATFFAYSYFHTVAWIDSTNKNYFEEIVQILYEIGCDPFIVNDHKIPENAFQSVMKNNQIMEQERGMRYMVFAEGMTELSIKKIIRGIFNTGSHNELLVDRLRLAICVKPDVTMNCLANIFVTRTFPPKCTIRDMHITGNMKLLFKLLSGIDDCYRSTKLSDSSLEFFFNNCNANLPNINDALKNICNKAYTQVFSKDNYLNNDNPDRFDCDFQSLGIFIGEMAHSGYLIDMYQEFVLKCLSIDDTKLINNMQNPYTDHVDNEIRSKVAIRTIIQSGMISMDINESIKMFPPANNFIKFTFEEVLKTIKTVGIQDEQNNKIVSNTIDIEQIIFFTSLKPNNVNEVLEDSFEQFKLLIEKYPSYTDSIIERYLVNYLEICSIINDNQMNDVNRNILIEFDKYKTTIKKNKDTIDEIINDIKIDSPKAPNFWADILQLI